MGLLTAYNGLIPDIVETFTKVMIVILRSVEIHSLHDGHSKENSLSLLRLPTN